MVTKTASSDSDAEQLLDLLFAHRMGWIQDFLRQRELSFAGDKATLRDRVNAYLDEGDILVPDLVELLDEIEGWGNQHIYLYQVPETVLKAVATEKKVRAILKRRKCLKLLNQKLPLLLPDRPTLAGVYWSAARLRFIWIEKRIWRERVPQEDVEEDDLEFDAYERKQARGMVAFDCDLVSGEAALLIQRLPSGNRYLEQKERFEKELEPFLDLSHIQEFRISPAIRKIDEDKKIRKRSTELQTQHGGRIVLSSKSRNADAYRGDPTIRKARKAVGHDAVGRSGNFYWPSSNGDDRETHVKLYAQDQRIGVFGESFEDEIRHVLSCIRGYCN